MTTEREPALSVVLTSLGGVEALRASLNALTESCREVAVEVIVPAPPRVLLHLGLVGDVPAFVRPLPLPAADDDPWLMRGHGVRAARAPIVATLEDHARPDQHWGAAVLQAHHAPHAAIGGVVAKSTPDTGTGWAMYFLDYGRYIPPQVGGPRHYLSACNVTYKRAALRDVAEAWPAAMHETTVHFAMSARGETLWLDPSLVVRQRRALSWSSAIRELARHGEAFGADLARHRTPAARWMRVALMPLVPVVQVARASSHLGRAPGLFPAFVRSFPALVSCAVAWSWGEGRGLARGA